MGFKLRSGNKSGLPFKQMGASPANFGLMGAMSAFGGGAKQADIMNQEAERINKPTNEKAITITAKTDEVTPDKPRVATPKELRKKHKAEGNKVTLKERKAAGEGTVASRAVKTTGKGLKKAGSWINKMAEKRQKFQASEEGAAFRDDMNRSANIVAGDNRFATDNLEKHKSSTRASELHKVKMDNVERDQLETDQMNEMRGRKIQAYKDAEAKKYELDESESFSGGEDPDFTSPVSGESTSSARKAQNK